MQAALKVTTRVLPGNRVEFSSPELPEGVEVEVFVALPEPGEKPTGGVMDFLNSLSPVTRTAEEWAEVERELQEERDSWER